MKRNWKEGLGRIVVVLFVVAMILYEIITTEDLLKNWFSWNNGLTFALKIILIPAAIIWAIVWAVDWCRKGFKESKLSINWKEGTGRLSIVLLALLGVGSFIWIWVSTKELGAAIFVTILLIALLTIIWWIGEGFNKPKDDEYDE